MHLCVSPGERRVTISCGRGEEATTAKEPPAVPAPQRHHRRFPYRSLIPTALVLGVVLPFLFIRAAFLALEGSSICSSIQCFGRGFGGSSDTSSLELLDEWRKAFLEVAVENVDPQLMDTAPLSLDELILDMVANRRQDIRTIALKTKAMILKMDQKVRLARHQVSIYQHLASFGIPKSIHCLGIKLANQYAMSALARSPLPPAEYISRLTDQMLFHIALITDNILAASVVVSSALKSSAHPESMVFHIITDKKTYAPMHAWFALNPPISGVVEVKGLNQFDWPIYESKEIFETVKEIRQTLSEYRNYNGPYASQLLKPRSFSVLNYIRIHLPELFPDLDKIVFLDDDVVVRRDLSPLWSLDLHGKVNGAVTTREGKEGYLFQKTFGDYLNFSNLVISSKLERDQYAWLGGMNVFDLREWRKTNITRAYRYWLKLNRESGFKLWHLDSLSPSLIAFEGHVHHIESSWHLSGLGSQLPDDTLLEDAAVLHFSGPAKPWLEVGFLELREIWWMHVNSSDEFIRSCRIVQ